MSRLHGIGLGLIGLCLLLVLGYLWLWQSKRRRGSVQDRC